MKEDISLGALVAIYGDKPIELARLITDCQSRISDMLGTTFHPYDMQQVHATITGIGQAKPCTLPNTGFHGHYGKQGEMDFDGLINYLLKSGILPFQIQIGGFQKREYPFLSRGIQPYDRSFSFGGGIAFIVGWPIRGTPNTNQNPTVNDLLHENRIYPTKLDEIRQAAKGFGFLHKYYEHINDFDNDFYFRIGLFDSMSISDEDQEAVEYSIRQFLSDTPPITIEINQSDLYFVFSDKETLPRDSTKTFSISDPNVFASVLSHMQVETKPKTQR
jgi:hypothetical protein